MASAVKEAATWEIRQERPEDMPLVDALNAATKTGRVVLEAKCRLILARIQVAARNFDDAFEILNSIPADAAKSIGSELDGQVHYWRSVALAGLGDAATANVEQQTARKLLSDVQARLPEPARAGFAVRPDIRRVLGG